jgi:hypothetical protein
LAGGRQNIVREDSCKGTGDKAEPMTMKNNTEIHYHTTYA